jgi:membrane protein DedA with SNARE-associated domain
MYAISPSMIAYISAATLVAQGHLHPFGVLVSGAVGAAIGDQTYFYVFRGRLPRWAARYPSIEKRAAPLLERVRRHDSLMVLLIRFAPGLRIALAAACAWVGVSPWKYSVLNLLAAFAWALALLVLVAWLGPAWLAQYGLGGWRGALLVGLAVIGLFKVLGSYERRALTNDQRPTTDD